MKVTNVTSRLQIIGGVMIAPDETKEVPDEFKSALNPLCLVVGKLSNSKPDAKAKAEAAAKAEAERIAAEEAEAARVEAELEAERLAAEQAANKDPTKQPWDK